MISVTKVNYFRLLWFTKIPGRRNMDYNRELYYHCQR